MLERVRRALVDSESEQHVAAHGAHARVAAVDVEHAVCDHRAGAVDRAAVAFVAVDAVEVANGVEVPEHPAVFGGVGAEVAVHRAGEYHTGNRGERGRLRGAATGEGLRAWSGFGAPLLLAVGDAERGDVCQLLSYAINEHGSVPHHGKVLLNFQFGERGITGLALASDGSIVACMGWKKSGSGANILVVSPGGTILETHEAPADLPMRVAFGGADLGDLYLSCGDGGLYRAKGIGRRGVKR